MDSSADGIEHNLTHRTPVHVKIYRPNPAIPCICAETTTCYVVMAVGSTNWSSGRHVFMFINVHYFMRVCQCVTA